jgi:PadR family transcriptional regulator PadR
MTSKKLTAASSEPIILAILNQSESYGYAIIQRVRLVSKGALEWTDGMLYPVLHRLEKSGALLARWGKSEEGRRRRYYRISAAGKRLLQSERNEWDAINTTLNQLWVASHA